MNLTSLIIEYLTIFEYCVYIPHEMSQRSVLIAFKLLLHRTEIHRVLYHSQILSVVNSKVFF